MVNCVVICGRLTRNPELKRGASGTAFCQFSIAFNDRIKDEQGNYKTSFVNLFAIIPRKVHKLLSLVDFKKINIKDKTEQLQVVYKSL